MPNRTISLDEVSDAIRRQLVKDGENFSHWIRMQLRKYQPGESEPKVKPAPPGTTCAKIVLAIIGLPTVRHWRLLNECLWNASRMCVRHP